MGLNFIICTYNQPESLLVLQSVSEQISEKDRIVVCDDGSGLENTRKLSGLISELREGGKNIYYIWQKDYGFRAAKNRNNGLCLLDGGGVVFVDGDCMPNANFVENYRKALSNNGMIIVGSRGFIDEFGTLTFRKDTEDYRSKCLSNSSTAHYGCWTCNLGISQKGVFFDENYYGYGFEDTDFVLSSLTEDSKFLYCSDNYVYERKVATKNNPFLSMTSHALMFYCRNLLYFLDKHPDQREVLSIHNYLSKTNFLYKVKIEGGKIYVNSDKNSDPTLVEEQLRASLRCNLIKTAHSLGIMIDVDNLPKAESGLLGNYVAIIDKKRQISDKFLQIVQDNASSFQDLVYFWIPEIEDKTLFNIRELIEPRKIVKYEFSNNLL